MERKIPAPATRFLAPLHLGPRQARGSDLLSRESLRRLLSWPLKERRPDLAVVLVDADGDPRRQKLLEGHVADLMVSKVIGVAVQEFEAWLVADVGAVSKALGSNRQRTAAPESFERGEAKQTLTAWMDEHSGEKEKHLALRREIAERCDLDV